MKAGLKAIYLSGWQVAADANLAGQMYPDQSLYPADSFVEEALFANSEADGLPADGVVTGYGKINDTASDECQRRSLRRQSGGRRPYGASVRRRGHRTVDHARRRRRTVRGLRQRRISRQIGRASCRERV